MSKAAAGISGGITTFLSFLCCVVQLCDLDLTEGQFLFHDFFHNEAF